MTKMSEFTGITFHELIALPNSRLDQALAQGIAPDPGELVNREFRGFNPPAFARWFGFQKFIKGFWRDDQGQLAGYNLFVDDPRSGPNAPWVGKNGGGPDTRHGFYDVVPAADHRRYNRYPKASLLDYGSGRNHWLNPESRIRDYLVQVDHGNPALLLGKAYIDLGLFSVFSNFFILDRLAV